MATHGQYTKPVMICHHKGRAVNDVAVGQILFNIVLTVAAFLCGWVLNNLWKTVVDLQSADTKLAEKVSSIEVLVAGQYVKREALDKLADAIFLKLDRIENKLDGKADKT